jgi:hypothetical protein
MQAGPDIVRSFLSLPPDHEPGSFFCYNQGCTYALSAIITRLTGKPLGDYLRPRLFEPLGIEQAHWWQSAEGTDLGYSGLHVVTESIAKLGQLYLQHGRWDGRQLVPEIYVEQARRRQVDNSHSREAPDWQQGYGFQFWVCRHGAYRGDGACGQLCIVVPHADAVIAVTAQVNDMQAEVDLVWEHLLPALAGAAPGDSRAPARLADRLAGLSTEVIGPRPGPARPGVTFAPAGEPAPFTERLRALRVEPAGDGTQLTVVMRDGEHSFHLRPGRWAEGDLPGVHRLLPAVAVTGGWTGDEEFRADIVFVTSPHRLHLRARTGREPFFATEWGEPPLP